MDLSTAKIDKNSITCATLKKVDGSIKERVQKALRKFAENPLCPGLDFKKRTNEIYYSIRASREIRIYMTNDGEGNMTIIEIGNHDFP